MSNKRINKKVSGQKLKRSGPRSVGRSYTVAPPASVSRARARNKVAGTSRKDKIGLPLLQGEGTILKEKLQSTGAWRDFSPMVRRYMSKIEHKRAKAGWSALILVIPLVFFLTVAKSSFDENQLVAPQDNHQSCIWEICAVDTMKTSRDMARTYLNNPDYDEEIIIQLQAIKETGADYVSVTTPYDDEFLPYLERWVKLARQEGLKVWFRGNWSSWEGWFGYPKNMTPEEHLAKNSEFIGKHSDLFQNGDIFDPCPECENAGFWPQNDKNRDYQLFIQRQQEQTKADFDKINKQVMVYPSIIGGRAKDVLDQGTFDSLDNVIAIDHYVPKTQGMSEFIDYFKDLNTKSLISEFGAPIPDMNGFQNEKQQAEFVRNILEVLYQKRDSVEGLNYWVLSHGTTAILNPDYSKRAVFDVLKEYFSPARVEGRVVNPLGEGVKDLTLRTSDNATKVKTDDQGYYYFTIPPRQFELMIDDPDYSSQPVLLVASESGQIISYDFLVEPENPGFFYNLKRFWRDIIQTN